MWDDARRSAGSDDDLLRQAYLLTGDPDRAERLARQALAAAAQHARRAGPAGSDEVAGTELVRAVLAEAEPGDHARSPLPPGGHAPAGAALGGLPARRRAVLVLRYAEGLPDERIADRVGTTPRSVHVDAEAGLLTLGPALAGDRDPGRLVAAALADAGRRWGGGGRGSGAGGAGAAAPVDGPRGDSPPGPRAAGDGDDTPFAGAAFPLEQPRPRHRLRTPAVLGAAGLTALVLAAAAILVPPALGGATPLSPKAAPAAETP